MMALDKELRPDHRHTIHRDRGASSEGSMSPENRCAASLHLFPVFIASLQPYNPFFSVPFSPSPRLLQGPRPGSAPLPQLNEPRRPRPHLLGPPAQRPGRTDGGGARPSRRRRARRPGPEHDGLSGRDVGPPPPPPPSPAASSTCRGHERRLHVPSTIGLQVNIRDQGQGRFACFKL